MKSKRNGHRKVSRNGLLGLLSISLWLALELPATEIWDGPPITFTKADGANEFDSANQDQISSSVWITRGSSRGIFNANGESGYSSGSPSGTEWAYGKAADYASLQFRAWINFCGGSPPSMVGKDAVVHLISEDIYIDIKFTAWTAGGGGGFSYVRGTKPWVVLTLNGGSGISILQHSTFRDPGATAIDLNHNPLTIVTNGVVDPETLGTYTMTYSADDGIGHSVTNTRTVTVVDHAPPMFISMMPSYSQQSTYANAALNEPIEVWGRAWGGLGPFNYTLDFGDGQTNSGIDIASDQTAFYVGAPHSYSSSGSKVATLSITDTATGTNLTRQVVVRVIGVPTHDQRVNMAIESGKLYLYKNHSVWDTNRVYWLDGQSENGIGTTGFALLAFEENGHLPTDNYQEDIYAEVVQKGINTLLSQIFKTTITTRSASDPTLDSNANGISANISSSTYANCLGMAAIIMGFNSTNAAKAAVVGTGVYTGTNYFETVRDLIDTLYCSQSPLGSSMVGGWHYSMNALNPNSDADGSTHQWPNIVMLAAYERWGFPINSNVISKSMQAFASLQGGDGGCGYGSPNSWENLAKTGGMLGGYTLGNMFVGNSAVDRAIQYISTYWNNAPSEGGAHAGWAGDFYAMYGIKKGLQLQGIVTINAPDGPHNWYQELSGWLLGDASLVGTNVAPTYRNRNTYAFGQQPNGSWTASGGFISVDSQGASMTTADAILVLTKAVTKPLPVASIAAIPDQSSKHPAAFNLDGSASYHMDPNSSIVEYLWDFDASNGVDWSDADASGKVTTANPGWTNIGTYTVTLRVKDNSVPPNYATATRIVNVVDTDVPPVSLAIPPSRQPQVYTAKIGSTIVLDGTSSYDPDGDAITAYAWDLNGDGIYGGPADAALDTSGQSATGSTASVIFSASYNGQIGLQVTANGKTSANTTSVDVYASPNDLSAVTLTTSSFVAGGSVNAHAVVTNDNNSGQGFSSVLVKFYNGDPFTSGAQLGTNFTVNLPIGSSATIDTTLAIPGLTNFDLYVFVDANNAVPEYNESNNVAYVTLIGGGGANHAPVVATPIADQNGTYATLFSFTFASGTFTDPDNNTMTYSASGLPSGITFNPATRTFSGTPITAGGFTVEVVANDGQSPALTVTDSFNLAIAPASLTVNADNTNRIYGHTNPALTGSLVGVASGDTITASFATPAVQSSPIGGYDILPVWNDPGNKLANYTVTTNKGTLTVNAATLTATADNLERIYGATNPVFTAHYSGFVNGQNASVITGQPALSSSALTNSPVGPYAIVIGGGSLSAPNYTFSYQNGTLSVTQAMLTVTANNQNRVYGTNNPTLTGSLSGVTAGDNLTASFATAAVLSSPVGNYDILPVWSDPGSKLANYSVTTNKGTLTIGAATLVATADSFERSYGATNPVFTAHYSGFVNGQNGSVISGQPSLSTTAVAGSPVGPYTIVIGAGTLSAPNYTFSCTNGTLTVTQASLTVTANNQNRAYGTNNPTLTGSLSGVTAGDTLTASFATAAVLSSPVGNYDILPVWSDPGSKLANYSVTTNKGTLTIGAATLVATADSLERCYGATNPVFTAHYSGFVNGQNSSVISGQPTLSTTATTNSSVGPYVVTIGAGTLSAPNYTFSYQNGTLTITQAVLTVVADNQSRAYGVTNPILTASFQGFANNDDTNVLNGEVALSTLATVSSPVGQYDIDAAQGTLSATNYSFVVSNGVLTVTAAALTVTADNQDRIYGANNPALTGSLTGVLSGDNISVSFATGAGTGSPVGNYDILPVWTDPANKLSNYTVTTNKGTLRIGAATLVARADSLERVYGANNPTLTAHYSGFVNGEDTELIIGQPSLSTIATVNSAAGSYPILIGVGTLSVPNYTLSFQNGTLTVTQAVLLVTADDKNRAYGTSNPPLTWSLSGFVNGENAEVVAGQPGLSTLASTSSSVGQYPIVATVGSLGATNYSFATSNGVLTVSATALTVTGNHQSRPYGEENPVLTGSLSGVVPGDHISVTLVTSAQTESPIGSYEIIPTWNDPGDKLANYVITTNKGTLSVTAAPLVATPQDVKRPYGKPNPPLTGSLVKVCNNDNITAIYTTTATASSQAGTYPITVRLEDPTGKLGNYAVTLNTGILTVAASMTFSTNPAPCLVGKSPAVLDPTANFSDGTNRNYEGATLRIRVITNSAPEDAFSVLGHVPLSVNGNTVSYQGHPMATFTGGTINIPLVFSFTTNANAAAISALLQQVSFTTASTNSSRTRVLEIALTYDDVTVLSQVELNLYQAPMPADAVIVGVLGSTLQIPFADVLTNVFDADGDTLTILETSLLSAFGGSITISNTSLVYVPPSTPVREDAFTYLVDDGHGGHAVGVAQLRLLVARHATIDTPNSGGSGVRLSMPAEPMHQYQIQFSEDLIHWTYLSTVTASAKGIVELIDSTAKGQPERFYRFLAE